jgi:hypothetical protein
VFTEFVRRPSWQGALAAGVLFALCAHCRQIATPLLILGLVILVLGNRKGRVMFALAAFAVYLCCCAPWSLRNQRLYGGYALSYHLGPNIFTKLTSFKLQDTDGKKFSIVKPVLLNVEQDLGIAGYAEPEHPEDNWDVNKIPHRMMDSLVKNHGYSYSNATGLLTAVSIEGFLRHPGLYARSIVKTGYALLFEHHETVPAIADVFPKSGYFPYAVRAPVRSFVTLDSFLFLLFVCFGLWKRERLVSAVWLPFLIVCYGYLSVAMVQVGFSRYAVPWTPFAAMIAAYVMSEAASSILPIKPKSAASSVAKRQYDEF